MAVGILSRYEDESNPPSDGLSTDYRLGWAMAALKEAEGFYANQPNFDKINRTRELLYGLRTTYRDLLGLSTTHTNHLRRIYNILSADMIDVRPFWNYSTYNRKYERQSRIYTDLATSWYQRTGADRQLSLMIKQSLISGSGVAHIRWDRRTSDIKMTSMNPLDVLPIRLSEVSDSFQDAFAVIIRKEMTVNAARDQFKRHADYIKADRDAAATGLGMRHRDMARAHISTPSILEAAQASDGIPDSKLGALPVVDIFYLYLDDRSLNDSSSTILMGDWGRRDPNGPLVAFNHWSYEVEPKQPKYPFKRLIIFTRRCVLYDGPSMYWHGLFPVAKFTPDIDPEDFLGQSPLWPCLDLQDDLNRIYRAIMDHCNRVLRPPVKGDQFSKAALRKADPRKAHERWEQDARGKGLEVVDFPPLDPQIELHRQTLISDMEQISGVRNLADIMSKNQIPEGETVEKLLHGMSPEIRARSRQLEIFQTEVGKMMSNNFAEFYDEPRRFEIFGEDGLVPEDFDFDPWSIVPAYTNGDFALGGLDPDRTDTDLRPRWVRNREFNRQFNLTVRPGSLMESASKNRKLMLMLLRDMKPPLVDSYTVQKEMGLDNIGPEPPGTVNDRLKQERMEALLAASPMGMMGMGMPGMSPPMPGPSDVAPNPNSAPEGNQREYSAPPSMEGGGIVTS